MVVASDMNHGVQLNLDKPFIYGSTLEPGRERKKRITNYFAYHHQQRGGSLFLSVADATVENFKPVQMNAISERYKGDPSYRNFW